MAVDTFTRPCRIHASHPALAGHFPGRPLVPGVVLLEQVALALRAWRGERLARVLEAKFLHPLPPDVPVEVLLHAADGCRVRFEIRRGEEVFARGRIEGAT